MKKANKYMDILYTLQTHKYREPNQLHKMMGAKGMTIPSTRYGMIKRLEDSGILVKQGNVYQVVEHEEYKNM